MTKTIMISSLFFLFVTAAQAKFVPTGSCGKAQFEGGTTCSDFKVKMTFEGCKISKEAQAAQIKNCKSDEFVARVQEKDFRLEATFKKKADGWNAAAWEVVGKPIALERDVPVKRTVAEKKEVEKKPVESKPVSVATAEVKPAEPKPAESTASAAAEGAPSLKFSGYLDFRYTSFNAPHDPNVTDVSPLNGFALEEGAFFINYEKEKVQVVVDVALRHGVDADPKYNDTSGTTQSNTNNIMIGVDKSQAYLKYKITDILTADFGQFDSIFGYEAADSKDRAFSKTGIVSDNFLPTTHTGLMLESSMGGFTGKVFVANPSNKSTQGTVSNGDYRTEYGATVAYSNENYRFLAGYLIRPLKRADSLTWDHRDLIDVTAGVTFGNFSMDVEFDQLRDPSKNTLTSTDTTDVEEPGQGYMGLLSYKLNENWLLGLRYDYIKNDAFKSSIDTADSQAMAIHYKLSSDLELRQEFTNYNYKNLTGDKWSNTRILFSTLWNF